MYFFHNPFIIHRLNTQNAYRHLWLEDRRTDSLVRHIKKPYESLIKPGMPHLISIWFFNLHTKNEVPKTNARTRTANAIPGFWVLIWNSDAFQSWRVCHPNCQWQWLRWPQRWRWRWCHARNFQICFPTLFSCRIERRKNSVCVSDCGPPWNIKYQFCSCHCHGSERRTVCLWLR